MALTNKWRYAFALLLQVVCSQAHALELVLVGIAQDPKPRRTGGCELEIVPIGRPVPSRVGNLICGYPQGAVVDSMSGMLVLHGPTMENDVKGTQLTRVQVGKVTKVDSVQIPGQSIESIWLAPTKDGKAVFMRRYALADLSPTGQLKPGALHFMALTADGMAIPNTPLDSESPPIGSGYTTDEGTFGSAATQIKCGARELISLLDPEAKMSTDMTLRVPLPDGVIKGKEKSGFAVQSENGSLGIYFDDGKQPSGSLVVYSSVERSWSRIIQISAGANPFFVGSILIVPETEKKRIENEDVQSRTGAYSIYDTDHKLEWKMAMHAAEEIIGSVEGDLIVFDGSSEGIERQKVYRVEKISAKRTLLYSCLHHWDHAFCMKAFDGFEKCLVSAPGIITP